MFRSRPRKRALRIFFATEIHGSERCFRKFLAAAQTYEADVLVLGGDIAGKGLVPIRADNGTFTAQVRGETVAVPRAEEQRLRDDINRLGFYSVIADDDSVERMTTDARFLDEAFRKAIIEQIDGWCRTCASSSRRETTTHWRSIRSSSQRLASNAPRVSCTSWDRSCWPAVAT